jgi:Cu/Ag efflux pump CusA
VTVPIALVGGELAGLIDGRTFSLGALAGLLLVLGVAARNVIVLIRHYQRLEQGESFGPELVVRGSRDRLAPIVITAAATAAALLPFVALGNRPGYEIVHPMAVVVLGGLVTSTLLTLFVVPVLYLRFGRGRRRATPEDDLLAQWAGAEPEPERAASGAEVKEES